MCVVERGVQEKNEEEAETVSFDLLGPRYSHLSHIKNKVHDHAKTCMHEYYLQKTVYFHHAFVKSSMSRPLTATSEVGNVDDLLSKILSVQQSNERIGSSSDALGLINAVDDLLLDQQLFDIAEEILKVLLMEISNNETPDGQSLADNVHEVLDAIGLTGIVLRDHSTCDDSSVDVEVIQRGLQSLASDVLKVNVDTLRRQLLEGFVGCALLVVESVVETDLLEKVVDLLVRSRYCTGVYI
jgi:hypothetical protein